MSGESTKLKWKRGDDNYWRSTSGRWVIWCSSRDRKRPLWRVFEVGVGVRDIASGFEDAKQVANEWETGTRKAS